MIDFFVPGVPATAGSKKGFIVRMADGRQRVAMAPDNKRARPWMAVVADVAARHISEPIDGPVSLWLVFEFTRPKGHFGAKGLKPSAPAHHTKKPDATKLLRAVEDAMKGIAWQDDSQVVQQFIRKIYSTRNGVRVRISRAT